MFPTSTYGYVGGDNSVLFRTTDAGHTWRDRTPIFYNKAISSIDATLDGKVAYATVAGHVSSTLDGVNWKGVDFSLGDTLNYPIDVIKIHNDTIFIFQKQNKYRITRTFAGKWWATRLTPASEIQNPTYSINPGLSFNDMYFDDNTGEGIAVGTWGTMYKLSNYGTTGEFLHHCNIGNAATSDWVHVQSVENNPDILHAIAHRGNQFAHSSDGGVTWLTRVEKNYGFGSYMGLHFSNDSTGIIFTSSRKSLNTSGFLNTTDNGASWKYEAESIRDNMYSVGASASGKLYITADSTVYRSLDDGYTWDTLWSFGISFFDTSLHQVRFMIRSASFLNDDMDIFLEMWAMDSVLTNPIDGGRITHSLVLASTDGGASWEKRHSFPQTHTLNGLRFITPELGYAITYFTAVKDSIQSTCWQTTDGGYTWKPLLELERSWTPLVFGKNGKYGILASTSGSDFYVTTDSGYTWWRDSVMYPEQVKFVLSHFIDDSTAMLTSNVGFWRKSFGAIKSGVEWKKATSNPYLFIYTYPSPATGSILHCKVDGLFSVADSRSIVLKMYDLLGREVLDLSQYVQKRNDRYWTEFEFSLQGVPKGVYTLVLTTSNGGAARNIVVIN